MTNQKRKAIKKLIKSEFKDSNYFTRCFPPANTVNSLFWQELNLSLCPSIYSFIHGFCLFTCKRPCAEIKTVAENVNGKGNKTHCNCIRYKLHSLLCRWSKGDVMSLFIHHVRKCVLDIPLPGLFSLELLMPDKIKYASKKQSVLIASNICTACR